MIQKQYFIKASLYTFLVATAVTVSYVIGFLNGVTAERQSANYPLLREVNELLSEYYLGDMPTATQLEYGAIRGVLNAVGDQYSVFLEPPSQELETQSLQGEFGGIGVNLRRNETGLLVMSPFLDYPAIEAGIVEGDVLIAVDGQPILPEMPLDQVSALVRGVVGTEVTITYQHGEDEPHEVVLVREKVEIPSVTGRILEQDESIGLLVISRFSEKTPEETQKMIDELQAQGATRLVIDLRGNGGGLLDSAVNTTSIFLAGGAILHEDKRGESERTFNAPEVGEEADVPLAVIVNHGTASAAEILAGALRDRGRAPLIGQTTYGKGSVQLIFELSDHSSIHITNARWFTPNRVQIDGVGLLPDIDMAPGTDGTDPELDRAIEYLQSP
jgi:carboxyl-terminal processing protease